MFDRTYTEKWIAVAIVIAFATLWVALEYAVPKDTMLNSVASIEDAVLEENWQRAKEEFDNLNNKWNEFKILIQVGNGTEEVLIVEQLLSQSSNLIKVEDDDVIEQLGGLRAAIKSTTVAFPGP